jgi:TonB family protein
LKIKWWYFPAGLWGLLIISCCVLIASFFLRAYTRSIAYRCADIAENYEDGGEYEKAAQWYGRASKLRRGDWRYQYGQAEAWRKLGRWEEALEAYDAALALEAQYIFLEDVYLGKAQALAGLGRWGEAVEAYGETIKPELARPCQDLCEKATDRFESERYEVTVGGPLDLHATVWDEGKYVEVMAYLKAAHELEPRHGYPYYMGGRAWLALEQYEKAASYFDAVVDLVPNFAPGWERKAWALALVGRYEPALACADTALILDAGDLNARDLNRWGLDGWNTKGKILLFAGEAAAARECFDRALAQASSSTEALIGKGITYFAEGNYDEARTYFEGLAGAYGPPYHLLYLYLVDRVERRPAADRLRPLLHAPPDPWPEKIRHVLIGRMSAEDLIAEAEGRRDLTEYPPGRYEPALPGATKKARVRVTPPGITGAAAGNSLRSSAVIARIVNQRKAGIEYIYKKYLKTNPTMEGKLVVRFDVAASGAVTACSVVSSTLGNAAMEREVCGRIVTWRFPPIHAGTANVVYPFVFFCAGAG